MKHLSFFGIMFFILSLLFACDGGSRGEEVMKYDG